ncbi:MAG: hypothetical protein ACI4JJ_05920 [Huintestinicola sp.]
MAEYDMTVRCDRLRFHDALSAVLSGNRLVSGIGTQHERTVHAVLKNYFEPFSDSQEQKIGGYIADIVGENGIIEIQTAQFANLKEKLRAFLPIAHVTVVYPVYRHKTIVTLSGETREIKSRRRSPLKGSPYDLLGEIFPIAEFLTDPNLSFVIMVIDADEYRIPPESLGKKKNRRGRLSVADRIPTELVDEIVIEDLSDWQYFVPCLFEEDFTTADLAEAAKISLSSAQLTLNALFKGGIVERTGKKGRSYTYRAAFQQ